MENFRRLLWTSIASSIWINLGTGAVAQMPPIVVTVTNGNVKLKYGGLTLSGVKEVQGTLAGVVKSQLLVIREDGSEARVPFDKNAEIQVTGVGGIEVLFPGAMVVVQGEATSHATIDKARIVMFLSKRIPVDLAKYFPKAPIAGGVHSAQAEGPDKIPVAVAGVVQTVSPLVIRGTPALKNVYQLDTDAKKGLPYKQFAAAGKSFEVEPLADNDGKVDVQIELASLKYAGKNAQVKTVTVTSEELGPNIGITPLLITVTRTEPVDPLEIRPKTARSKTVAPAKAASKVE